MPKVKKNPVLVAWMKIYDPEGKYQASCVDVAGAAALMSFYGTGAEIRNGHSKKKCLWKEGAEDQPAGESYDFVIETINSRMTTANSTATPQEAARDARTQASLEQTRAAVRAMLAKSAS